MESRRGCFEYVLPLIVLLSVTHVGGIANNSECLRDYYVNRFELVVTWAPGYCSSTKSNCKNNVEPKFSIHGFWPQGKARSPTYCCTKERFDLRMLAPVAKDMRIHWTSLNGATDETIWAYQWGKHGTCATGNLNTIHKYFNFVMDTYKSLNLKRVMDANRYHPDSGAIYHGGEIIQDLSAHFGRNVSINCAPWKKNTNMKVLTEIAFCYGTNLKQIDCKYTRKQCLGALKLPSSV